MIENYRSFQAGPDPFGRTWTVTFLWQQNGISIRHADTVDCKFRVSESGEGQEKVIALPHPGLLAVCRETSRPLTDAWCMKLAAEHLREMILTDRDMEQEVVTVTVEDLKRHASLLDQTAATTI